MTWWQWALAGAWIFILILACIVWSECRRLDRCHSRPEDTQ